jgi:hypothetical protein
MVYSVFNAEISDDLKTEDLFESKSKNVLMPVTTIKLTEADKIDHIKIQNMKALISDNSEVVHMRCIVLQDNEPMHLLQAFQGSLVVKTNDYLKRR